MKNISNEANKILKTIELYQPIKPGQLQKIAKLSSKNTYKHLKNLQEEDLIRKEGTASQPFYYYNQQEDEYNSITTLEEKFIEANYLYLSPIGEIIRGVAGFKAWCKKNNFDFDQEKVKYYSKFKEIKKLKKNDLISAKKIILSGKKELYMDNIFFSDFYTFDYFGKTKLGQLVYLAKSSQNKELTKEIVSIIKPSLFNLIRKYNIKQICFVPPTIDRKVQFMDQLKKNLKLNLVLHNNSVEGLKEILVAKVSSKNKIPQKTLRKLEDRIENAKKTIAIDPTQLIDSNTLIIDDATGSGATLNEIAKKIRFIAKAKIKIYGYSVVGSYKGFDVISEV